MSRLASPASTCASRTKGNRVVELYIEPDKVFVVPNKRGLGYGIDLGIAIGNLCADMLRACYRAVKDQTTIDVRYFASAHSLQGEQIAQHVADELRVAQDLLEDGEAREVEISLDIGIEV